MGFKIKLGTKNPPVSEEEKNQELEHFLLFFDGKKSGPYTKNEIIAKYSAKEISDDAMLKQNDVWTSLSEAEWIPRKSMISAQESETPEATNDSRDETMPEPQPETEPAPAAEGPVTTCPHCWHKFYLSHVLFIAKHIDLRGDPILGADAQMRFLPTTFNRQGYAVDARGLVCQDMACPNCHLKIPEAIIDIPSCSFSIVGAPQSGKSYYLTAMTWQLRKILAGKFDYTLADTDATFNFVLNKYEQNLFLNRNPEEYISLPKTHVQGTGFSNQILLNGMSVDLPLPFIFSLTPLPSNPRHEEEHSGIRNLILYDNAGEHFIPGEDRITNQATLHLMHSAGIVFLYDPIKDSRMLPNCDPNDPQVSIVKEGYFNQLVLLNEMISRIRKYTGLKSKEKYHKPLIVTIPKYDAWKHSFPILLEKTNFLYYSEREMTYSLDLSAVTNVSFVMRDELLKIAPEIVATCEAFFTHVYYLPLSALGQIPEYDEKTDQIAVKPRNIKPIWAEVPMLLQLWLAGLLPAVKVEYSDCIPVEKYRFTEDTLIYEMPRTRVRDTVPKHYLGYAVYSSKLREYIRFPDPPEENVSESRASKTESAAEDDFWNQ